MRLRLLLAAAVVAVLALAPVAQAGAPAPVTWCGTDQVGSDRKPDAVPNALQVHVIYAHPSDGPNNFAALANGIVTDLAAVNAWWQGQDSTRRIRFDMHNFPNCGTEFGQLDISVVQLPNPASHYQALDTRTDRLTADLKALGFTDPDKKYLVYYDGSPVDVQTTCGEAEHEVKAFEVGNTRTVWVDISTFANVFLGACSQVVGTGTIAAITAAHELAHSFAALDVSPITPGAPPNPCPGDLGHPCDSDADLLTPTQPPGATLSSRVLDVNNDDYYNHSGDWIDIRDSLFLLHLDSADQAAPAGPRKANATSEEKRVPGRKRPSLFAVVTWPKARDASGVTYRVYKDGELERVTKQRKFEEQARKGAIIVYGVRAVDPNGNLGPLRTVRFRVGFGIVNAKGKVIKDTVPPPTVKNIQASQSGANVIFRWAKVKDTVSPLKHYLVKRNGKRFALVKTNSITVPLSRAAGRWTVQPVDTRGNTAPVIFTRIIRVG